VSADDWIWDETLYAGSAAYYAQGRLPYPAALADALRGELALDGTGRLLDVGCGPGSLGLLLAPLFAEVVGVDADAGMVAEAGREAARRGVRNVGWVQMRAEDLPGSLGTFRVATFAQSFHWMDRPRVAAAVGTMLEAGGAWVHVNATTHRGVGGGDELPAPAPPRERITSLVRAYLGPVRRAGRGALPDGTPALEDEVIAAAGFEGPRRLEVGGGRVFDRSEDEIVASVFSLSSAAPHLFGERLGVFEEELRQLLREISPNGRFSERAREIELVVWRKTRRASTAARSRPVAPR
jgi:SAM-dependent methyltransferase